MRGVFVFGCLLHPVCQPHQIKENTMTENPSPNPAESTGTTPIQNDQAAAVTKTQLITVLALLLGVSFFLPWISIFGLAKISGFAFAKEGGAAVLLWLWPILSAIALSAAATGKNFQIAGQLAGVAPFAVLGYAIAKEHNLQFIDNIMVGGWLGLACGLLLLITARR
jgi:hypothetical protein